MSPAEIVNDFRRKYEGTFCWLEVEKATQEALVRVVRVEDHPQKGGTIQLESSKYGNLTLNLASDGYALKFKHPPVGVFQYKQFAFYFMRRPQRQWQRGLCPGNSLLRNVEHNISGNFARFSADEIQAAFDHKVFDPKEALWMLNKQQACSVALPNDFAVSLSFRLREEFVLFHWRHPVALLDKSTGKVTEIVGERYAPVIFSMFPVA